jgi:hypothetical protein
LLISIGLICFYFLGLTHYIHIRLLVGGERYVIVKNGYNYRYVSELFSSNITLLIFVNIDIKFVCLYEVKLIYNK